MTDRTAGEKASRSRSAAAVVPLTAAAPDDERSLIERLRRKDGDAFEELVRRHLPAMLAVARRLLKNDDDAEEAVQEALLSAFKSIERFREDARLTTWLHRIVTNAALMRLRKASHGAEVSIDDLLPAFGDDGHALEPAEPWPMRAEDVLSNRELRAAVRACIDKLPETYRTVLVLRDIEEMSTADAADVLGITCVALKVRLHRARQALLTLLRDSMPA